MTVIIDMNENLIKWVINDIEVASTEIGDLRNEVLVPYLEILHGGSKV